MLDVTIYYVDGWRSLYEHVTGIYCNDDKIILQFNTDFNDNPYNEIILSTIAEMRIKVHE